MKTIELIDKYEIHQSNDADYNPPSYEWIDNTGELIRCKDCKHRVLHNNVWECLYSGFIAPDHYCSYAERREK